MVNISFPDGRIQAYESGITALEIAEGISSGLARNVLAAKVNDEIIESTRPITQDAILELLTWQSKSGKQAFWHSSAHLLAEALEDLFPGMKFGIGPAVDNGFYYDVDTGEHTISSDDFDRIEKKMIELARQKNEFRREVISREDALKYFKEKGDEYKVELINDLIEGEITLYHQGNFTDLCKGGHIPHTGLIKAIKILKIGGAYWRGDESRKQMTRIYGVSFPKQKELTAHLEMLEEAKKRDHRKIGAEMELFMFSEKVGQGLPIWLPKGTALRERLQNFLREQQSKQGYEMVITPHIGKKELYVTSGHYEKYGADSFQPIKTPKEGEEFLLKPMNCPHHCEIYGLRPRSYRELPVRYAEFGTVYRYEQSGELHGLSRVRGFTQDDAHIFCTTEQLREEFLTVLALTTDNLTKLGFKEFTAQISLRDPDNPDKYLGTEENWNAAEKAIIEAVAETDLETVTELGEAAFYGPKLDFMIKDALGREWQLGTIQVDYNLPIRFDLSYIGADNQEHRPVMIHRAPFGSMERFISILIEHTGGKFPLWISPEQFIVLTLNDTLNDHAYKLVDELALVDIRGSVDERTESIGRKIRDAELSKIPIMLIVGDKERQNNSVSVRVQGEGDKGMMSLDEFKTFFKGLL